MERLDKILAGTGRWYRREVKELVRQGRVTLDGAPAASPEQKLEPTAADIRVDGEPVAYRRFTYILLHKPAGVLSAVEDSRQKTVLDLLPPELRKQGLSPVGRLDKDTEGLLLLTNDGALTHRLLTPKNHVDKVYYARTEGTPTAEDAARLAQGITLPDGRAEDLRGGRGAFDPAGREIPSGQADAGRLRHAGGVSQAALHGAADAGEHAAGRKFSSSYRSGNRRFAPRGGSCGGRLPKKRQQFLSNT